MDNKVYVFEGKTSTEAIEKGLKELKVTKSKVEIKVLESEEKRSFFSILSPRVVKVEMKLKDGEDVDNSNNEKTKGKTEGKKEGKTEGKNEEKKEVKTEKKAEDKINEKNISTKSTAKGKDTNSTKNEKMDLRDSKKIIEEFLKKFVSMLPQKDIEYSIKEEEKDIIVTINGNDVGYLIGYRGEVLNSLQAILTNVVSKSNKEKQRVLVDICGYRDKREQDLENLASKIASTVIRTKKDITLEPMSAYERKIIHNKLQENSNVKTYSIGEEPYRKVVVAYKK